MAENNPASPTPTPNPATPPADPKGSAATPAKSEEGIMIPKQRFDEALQAKNDAEAALAAIKAEKATAETKQLEEQKKFEELYTKEKEAHTATKSRVDEILRRSAFISAASGKNIASLDDAYILAKPQLAALKIEEGDKVVGIEDVIAKLIEAKPFLVGKATLAPVGSPTNPAPNGGGQPAKGKIWSKQEIDEMDQATFNKNKDDINKAVAEGRIR